MNLRLLPALCAASVLTAPCSRSALAQLQESNVLVLYNSQQPESQAVRDMYVAAYPGVLEFDVNSSILGTAGVSRTNYLNIIRNPLRDFINGVNTGQDLSQQVMCIVTTRGMPTQLNGANEFQIFSSWASVESELTLLQQDLEGPGTAPLTFLHWGPVDNPYHARVNQPVTSFSRANVTFQRSFIQVNGPAWQLATATPGDMYLVCRLDAAPTDVGTPDEVTALQHIQALINRTIDVRVPRCGVQAVLDEFAGADQLDDDGIPPAFPIEDDYDATKPVLDAHGIFVRRNQNTNFVTGPELTDQTKPVFVLGTYGENHDADGFSENPPGAGTFFLTYTFHPGAIVSSIESFNGNSIITGLPRGGQGQVLDAISHGASFTVGHVREPFSFFIEDLHYLTINMLDHGLTFAEAVYSSLPAISWQCVPVGNPLARITLLDLGPLDRNLDGAVDIEDAYAVHAAPVDLNCDAVVDGQDFLTIRNEIRAGEGADIDQR